MLAPVGLVVLVAGLLLLPVVVLEGVWGWPAYRRSAHLVRPRWVKVVVLVALTTGAALAIGPLLGTTLILATSLPFAVSNAVSGIVYALLVPLVALAYVYVYADAVVSDASRAPARAERRAAGGGHPAVSGPRHPVTSERNQERLARLVAWADRHPVAGTALRIARELLAVDVRDRIFGMTGQAFLSLIPLTIIVSTWLSESDGESLANVVNERLGLTGSTAADRGAAVQQARALRRRPRPRRR